MNKTTNNKAREIELMAAWIKKVIELQKETGFNYHTVEKDHPEVFDKNLIPNDDYLIYWADVIVTNPIEEAREHYEAGYRLVPTENEPNGQFLDWWKTGLVLKQIL